MPILLLILAGFFGYQAYLGIAKKQHVLNPLLLALCGGPIGHCGGPESVDTS